MTTTEPQTGSFQDFMNGNTASKNFKFRLTKQNTSPTIRNGKGIALAYVGSCLIDATGIISEMNDKKQLVNRVIRYIEGEPSIYKDEQSPDDKIPKKRYKINFVRGYKVVNGTLEPDLLKYMMKDNLNASNPNRRKDVQPMYELIDNVKAIQKTMDDDMVKSKAVHFAYTGDWDEAAAYALVLGINTNRKVEEVRWDLKLVAERNPVKFLADLDSPTMKKKYHVLKAIQMGFMVVNSATNSIAWVTNQGQPLDTAVIGKDVIDSFVNKLSTDDGKLIYATIVDMVSPTTVSSERMVIPTKEEISSLKSQVITKEPILNKIDEDDKELEALLDKGVEHKLVVFKLPLWYEYKGENYKKREGFVEGLKNNPTMLKVLKAEVSAAESMK